MHVCIRVLRAALKELRAAPRSIAFSVATLALGVGAATVTFSVVDSVVFRSLPFDDPGDLVLVGPLRPVPRSVSAQAYSAWSARLRSLSRLGATSFGPFIHLSPDGRAYTRAWRLTASVFDVLGVQPLAGRLFTSEHEIPGNDNVAVISFGLWQRLFGGDAAAVGSRLNVAAMRDRSTVVGSVEIVGIMPEGFSYPAGVSLDAWVPNVFGDGYSPGRGPDGELRSSSYLQVVGRLADGVTIQQAQAELDALNAAMAGEPGFAMRERPILVPLHEALVEDVRGWMVLTLLAVAGVMIVASVNVSTLMLAQAGDRSYPRSVRACLGASAGELAAISMAESVFVAIGASGIGVLIAQWGLDLTMAVLPGGIPRAGEVAIDSRVIVVALVSTVGVSVLAGVAPAWSAARTGTAIALRGAYSASASRRVRWTGGIAIAEIALVAAVILVVTLFIWSFVRVATSDVGFDRTGVVVVDPGRRLADPQGTLAAVRSAPGALAAAAVSGAPPLVMAAFGGDRSMVTVRTDTNGAADGARLSLTLYEVSPDYFEVIGLRHRAGRLFESSDQGEHVAIIDEVAATALFDTADGAVGRRLSRDGSPTPLTVVGIVQRIQASGPEREAGYQLYLPLAADWTGATHILIRSDQRFDDMVATLRPILASQFSSEASIRSLDEAFAILTAGRRANASLMFVFGVVVVVIGAVGVYAVLASLVAQAYHDMAVRIVLGASRLRVAGRVIALALGYVSAGLALGLPAGIALCRLFDSLWFDVFPLDLSVQIAVAAVLFLAGMLAAVLPARRAWSTDPMVTIRSTY